MPVGQRILCFLFLALSTTVVQSTVAEMPPFQREARNFPYSMSLLRLLDTQRDPPAYYAARDDLTDILASLHEEPYSERERRSPKQKRYACRFKFCRIFDA